MGKSSNSKTFAGCSLKAAHEVLTHHNFLLHEGPCRKTATLLHEGPCRKTATPFYS